MYFVELKFDEEESENEEEKIKTFMKEAEGRIRKVLFPPVATISCVPLQ